MCILLRIPCDGPGNPGCQLCCISQRTGGNVAGGECLAVVEIWGVLQGTSESCDGAPAPEGVIGENGNSMTSTVSTLRVLFILPKERSLHMSASGTVGFNTISIDEVCLPSNAATQ